MTALNETHVSHGRHDVDIQWSRRGEGSNVNPNFFGFCALFKGSDG